MYLFLIFGLPLGFLLLVIYGYPRSEAQATRKAFGRGLAAFIPIWLVARLLGAIVPPDYGSFLLVFHEWADRLLPYATLPALAYLVFYRPGERLPAGAIPRRLTAFYAGSLSPVGLCEAARIWGSPEPYALFLLPLLLAAICIAMPKIASLVHESYGWDLAATIVGFILASLASSLCPLLFLIRFWPVALVVLVLACGGAWLFASPELEATTPFSYTE
jgi:hypothetical protein